MSQSFWEPDVEEAKPEPPPEAKPDTRQDPQADASPEQQHSDACALTLSVDDFSALEQRILRAVNLVKQERLARAAAEERAVQAESQLREQAPLIDQLQKELGTLRDERTHVRQRVERLLSQLDALEL